MEHEDVWVALQSHLDHVYMSLPPKLKAEFGEKWTGFNEGFKDLRFLRSEGNSSNKTRAEMALDSEDDIQEVADHDEVDEHGLLGAPAAEEGVPALEVAGNVEQEVVGQQSEIWRQGSTHGRGKGSKMVKGKIQLGKGLAASSKGQRPEPY